MEERYVEYVLAISFGNYLENVADKCFYIHFKTTYKSPFGQFIV